MRNRKTTTAIVLTGAVALASGAYALGSQSGDGSATAAAGDNDDNGRPALVHRFPGGGPDGPFGLDNLADRLGVDESKLEDAMRDLRPDEPRPPKPPGDFAKILADELGIDQSRVEDALERVHERVQDEMEKRRDDFAERLADRLNLDPEKVKEELDDGPPFGFAHRHRP